MRRPPRLVTPMNEPEDREDQMSSEGEDPTSLTEQPAIETEAEAAIETEAEEPKASTANPRALS